MDDEESNKFAEALTALAEVHGRKISLNAMAIYFRALEPYSWDEVSRAMAAHERDPENGKFFPVPANLIEHLLPKNEIPSADEMWALMPMSEEDSVVWTREAQDAFFNAALPLIEDGDMIAARMAFRAAYDRLCERAGQPEWIFSAGWDKDGREKVLVDAMRQKRLSPEKGFAHLGFLQPERKEQLLSEFNFKNQQFIENVREIHEPADKPNRDCYNLSDVDTRRSKEKMPSKSPKQHRMMEAVAHNPNFAKKVGIPQSVGKEFAAADKGKSFKGKKGK